MALRRSSVLAQGEPIAPCDARLQVLNGLVGVDQQSPPEPLVLAGLARVGGFVLLVLLALGRVQLRRTAPVIAVLMLLGAGFSAFVGTDRVTFDRARRQVHLSEGWFLNLYRSRRTLDYSAAMTLYANEEYEDETHWMRIWLRTAGELGGDRGRSRGDEPAQILERVGEVRAEPEASNRLAAGPGYGFRVLRSRPT